MSTVKKCLIIFLMIFAAYSFYDIYFYVRLLFPHLQYYDISDLVQHGLSIVLEFSAIVCLIIGAVMSKPCWLICFLVITAFKSLFSIYYLKQIYDYTYGCEVDYGFQICPEKNITYLLEASIKFSKDSLRIQYKIILYLFHSLINQHS